MVPGCDNGTCVGQDTGAGTMTGRKSCYSRSVIQFFVPVADDAFNAQRVEMVLDFLQLRLFPVPWIWRARGESGQQRDW